MRYTRIGFAVFVGGVSAVSLIACSEEFVSIPNVAGQYSIAVTSGANGCAFDNWEVGKSSSNIPFVITQDGTKVQGTLEGAVGTYVTFVLGSNTFNGTAEGDKLEMTLAGSRSGKKGRCVYTTNAIVSAKVSGDTLVGTLRYSPQTNKSPDCGALEGCISEQSFNGARPPK